MAVLIDTNVAILLRDREPRTTARIGTLGGDALVPYGPADDQDED